MKESDNLQLVWEHEKQEQAVQSYKKMLEWFSGGYTGRLNLT